MHPEHMPEFLLGLFLVLLVAVLSVLLILNHKKSNSAIVYSIGNDYPNNSAYDSYLNQTNLTADPDDSGEESKIEEVIGKITKIIESKTEEKFGCIDISGVNVCLSTIISVIKTIYSSVRALMQYTESGKFNLLPAALVKNDISPYALFGNDTIRDVALTVRIKFLKNTDIESNPSANLIMNFSWTTAIGSVKSSIFSKYDNVLYIVGGTFDVPRPTGPWWGKHRINIKLVPSYEAWAKKLRTFKHKITGKVEQHEIWVPNLKFEINAMQDKLGKPRKVWKFYILISADGLSAKRTGDILMDKTEETKGLKELVICASARPRTLRDSDGDMPEDSEDTCELADDFISDDDIPVDLDDFTFDEDDTEDDSRLLIQL